MRTKPKIHGLILLVFFIALVMGTSVVWAASGDQKWQYDTGGTAPSSPALGTDGTIYVGSGTSLHAITSKGSRKSGQWPYETGGSVISSPAIGTDGTIYVGSGDGYLHAVTPEGTAKGGGSWPYKTGESYVLSSPAIGPDETIYVISGDGYLHAVSPDGSSKEGWPCKTGTAAMYYSSPAIGQHGTVYVGSGTSLYAVNASGSIVWEYSAGGEIYSSPTVGANDVIYVGSHGTETGQLHAINPLDGSTMGGDWPYQADAGVKSSPAIGTDGTLYVGIGASLYAINPDGTAAQGEWPYQAEDLINRSTPAIGADGTIYVESNDNYLHAVNPDGTLKWKTETPSSAGSSPAIGTDDGTIYVGINAVEGDAAWTYDDYLNVMQAYAASYWPRFGQNSFNSHNKPAFAFELPDNTAAHPGSTDISVPITLANLFTEGIRSASMTIRFDNSALEVSSVTSAGGILENGYTLNSQIDGAIGKVVITITADTDTYVTGAGLIAELRMNVISEEQNPYSKPLTFSEAKVNDLSVSFGNGVVDVVPQYIISGNIAYFKNGEPVSNVTLNLANDTETYSEEATSDAQGNYVFADVPPGNYILTPAKTDELQGLSAFDAASILRYAEAEAEPGCHQMIAADVNMDKSITAAKATEVAICSGKRDLGVEYWMNTGQANWAFTMSPIETCEDWPPISYPSEASPDVRTYLSLDSDKSDADFVAILLGDVTGNWAAENPASSGKRIASAKDVQASTEMNVAVSSSLTLPIALDHETTILGIDMLLQFDSSVLEMTGATLASGILADWEENLQVVKNDAGQAALKIYGSDEITGKGNIAFVNFSVVGSLDTATDLSLSKLRCNEADVTGGFAVGDILAGKVTVGVKYGPGDIDHSGAVDLSDLLLALKVSAGIGMDAVHADADATGDGKIGMDDVLHILQVIAK